VYRQYVQSGIAPGANTVTTSAIAANTIQPWQLSSSLLNPTVNSFTGDGTTTSFTLSLPPASANTVVVTVNGITQSPVTNYSTNNTSLVFTSAPSNASVIRAVQQAMIGTSIVPIDGSVTTSKLGSSLTLSGNTTFSGAISGTSATLSSLTSGRITYAGASGLLTDSSSLTYNGTNLSVNGATITGGGSQIAGGGWGVIPYAVNSLTTDNSSGVSRFFATGANSSTYGSYIWYGGLTTGTTNQYMTLETTGNLTLNVATAMLSAPIARIGTYTAFGTESLQVAKSNGTGAVGSAYQFAINSKGSTNRAEMILTDGATSNAFISYKPSATTAAEILTFNLQGLDTLNVVGNGRVGIGTSSPACTLQVSNGAGCQLYVGLSNNIYSQAYDHIWQTLSGAATKMYLDSVGNLGLGIAPSAWALGKAIEVGNVGTAFWAVSSSQLSITQNAYYDVVGWKYAVNGYATRYQQDSGNYIWNTAPINASGAGAGPISFTQAMILNPSGFLGIGQTSPICLLDVYGGGAYTYARFYRSDEAGYGGRVGTGNTLHSAGATRSLGLDGFSQISFGIAGVQVAQINSSGNLLLGTTVSNYRLNIKGGGSIGDSSVYAQFTTLDTGTTATDGLLVGMGVGSSPIAYVSQMENAALVFQTNATEQMRITSTGFSHFKPSGSYYNAAGSWHSFETSISDDTFLVISSAASPYGMQVFFSAAVPNSTATYFYSCFDTSATRFKVYANGGIANYQANDANLSDRREKTNFAPATSYLEKICAIPVQTFNYIDQNREEDDGLTLGVVAQDVQAVAPELVTENNWGTKEEPKMRLSIYQTDLQYALMKCIQEQQALIESLTTTVNSQAQLISSIQEKLGS
jgi:hypothetical protein